MGAVNSNRNSCDQSPTSSEGFNMAKEMPNLQGFSLRLLKSLSPEANNVIYSPYSVASALMLVCLGARGDTFDQIVATLGLGEDSKVHETFKLLNDQVFAALKDGIEINIANKLYTRTGLELLKPFVEELMKYYEGGVESADFAGDTEGSREMINKWVEQQTKEKIKDLILPERIFPITEMVVVNAIYFKGLWETPFRSENTKQDLFKVSLDENVKVQMMNATLQLQHMVDVDLDMTAVAIPYQGRKLSMIILLPNKIDGIAGLQDSLTQNKIQELFSKLLVRRECGVELSLPRFKMTVASEMEAALEGLGITDIFKENINLTGMFKFQSKPIEGVVHKAHIEVNEQGTEAAAATATVERCLPLPFLCDRPFMFFILENTSMCILFIGKLCRPE